MQSTIYWVSRREFSLSPWVQPASRATVDTEELTKFVQPDPTLSTISFAYIRRMHLHTLQLSYTHYLTQTDEAIVTSRSRANKTELLPHIII